MTGRFSSRSLPMLFLAVALALVPARLALAAEVGGKDSAPKTPPVPVIVAPVTMQNVAPQIRAVGTVVPNQTVALESRIDSQIMEVRFHAGDSVKKGDPLFILDDRTLKAQLAQAQAVLAGDKAQVANLQAQYDRAQLGVKKGFFSTADRDTAKAAVDLKKAGIDADQAAIDNLRAQLTYTVVAAPIDGRTGTIGFTEGNIVKANDAVPLVTINQITPVAVQAAIPQDSFDAVRMAMDGGPVGAVAARGGGVDPEQGMLDYIDNQIDPKSGTFALRALFSNKDERLWPGMLVSLIVNTGKPVGYLTVPEVAIQHDPKGDFVFVVANGHAAHRNVTVARMQNDFALVTAGLKVGESVTIDGMMALQDGGAVTVANPPAAREGAKDDVGADGRSGGVDGDGNNTGYSKP
jgi:multidrug efflux system membrane fusion protein